MSFDYELPRDRIAQHPPAERNGGRLMEVDRSGRNAPVDRMVCDLGALLRPDDLLVMNRSRVVRARLRATRRPGGGAAELLLIAPGASPGVWHAMGRPGRRLREGGMLTVGGDVDVEIRTKREDGTLDVAFPLDVDVSALMERAGEPPLPPYIERPSGPSTDDVERYQTVFAREPGSIAAPTAGLHLTDEMIQSYRDAGVRVAEVILHVGPATFLAGRPGTTARDVAPERYSVPTETRDAIEDTSGRGRVVAVGTTTTRALESASRAGWPDGEQETSLVLAPGSRFEVVDALLTNFHLPGSSLLSLVSAFAGLETARTAYEAGVDRGYRFYSYGDAMFIG